MANLVIVESPAKANTIKNYLGSGYKVIASKGHIRDLPKSSLGIDVDNGFEPHYINIRGKGDVIKELKKEAKSAKKVFLATDPDREGEAISWHIASQLDISPDALCRVTFNEITKDAVKSAIKNPRKINEDLVNSQQARRILDRIVGFLVSEILWKKVKSGLSAGRVQSVATKIIADREAEIKAFVPTEYWTVEAILSSDSGDCFTAKFFGDANGRIKLSSKEEADAVIEKINSGSFTVSSVKHVQKQRQPAPPFTTSTMQQEASRKLGFQTHKTMKVAQELYDGLNLGAEFGGFQGLITYMRTDSLRISESAQDSALEYILNNYGEDALPKKKRVYKANQNAQDAHEAIRPSDINLTPQKLKKLLTQDQYKLYKLIFERFIASQMQVAILDTLAVEIENSGYIFKCGGYVVKSRGYMAVYDTESEGEDENEALTKLPGAKKNQKLSVGSVTSSQHFTEPPARYTEASLIKFLEENGIGRPSTYAPIISIITSRDYVKRDGKTLIATELGAVTTKFMQDNFPDIVDYEFTATMESLLDSIEHKKNSTVEVLSNFYVKFKQNIEDASRSNKSYSLTGNSEESGILCEKCGSQMVYKNGRFGRFLACASYPACKNTKAVDKDGNVIETQKKELELAGFKCELCGSEMAVRRGRYGVFYACSNYPTCNFTKQKQTDTGASCPKCSSKIMARNGRGKSLFYSCEKYPECDFSTWDIPTKHKCPLCEGSLFYKKNKKTLVCKNPECSYERKEEISVTLE